MVDGMCLLVVYVCVWRRRTISRTVFFLMIRRPPRSTLDRSSAASDVYKRQDVNYRLDIRGEKPEVAEFQIIKFLDDAYQSSLELSLIHISEPTRPY